MVRFIQFLFFTIIANIIVKAQSSMPIIAYYGPVIERLTQSDYNTMRECGFTHSLNIYRSLDRAQSDMALANQAGIKVFVHTPQLLKNPTNAVATLKNKAGFGGYFLADEPVQADASKYAQMVKTIQRLDSTHPCYINLNPYYNGNQLKAIGASSYKGYLQTMSTMGLPQMSFDFYPITKNGLRADTWFYTLNAVREESQRTNKSFWAFILSVPHGDYPQPTLAMLRLQCYINLAYGAQAIQYFTYRTPYDNKQYDFRNAPIEANGKQTKTFSLVKQMNAELKNVSKLFYGAKVTTIGHLIKIPSGCQRAKVPSGIKSLSVNGKEGAVVSIFSKNGKKYLAVINKDYERTMTLNISVSSNLVKSISKQLVESTPKSTYTVQSGDIALFKIQ